MASSNYFWATWLADAFRADKVLNPRVIEIDGWQTRGRPPGQFSFLPSGAVDHHTACMLKVGHDPQSCINAIIAGRSDAPGPIAQVLITATPPGTRWDGKNADPRVVVIAAGRANHAGAGTYPWGAPEGNGSSIGNEMCGPPTDEWPDIMIEVAARVTAAQLKWNGWPVSHCVNHHGYAPTRKIDRSGAWVGQPTLPQLTPWSDPTWRDQVTKYMGDESGTADDGGEGDDMPASSGSSSVLTGNGRLDNFVTGNDGALWHNWYEPGKGWMGWESLGGQLKSTPSASALNDPFRIDVTGKGTDDALWHIWYIQGEGWHTWEKVADWPPTS